MRFLSNILRSLFAVLVMVLLMSANMHLQTSASPQTQQIQVLLGREKVAISMDGPGVAFKKSPAGHLTYLIFFRLNTLVKIWYHPRSDMDRQENIRLVQRLQLVAGKWLLNGPTQIFDKFGELLSESNWEDGLLDGRQQLFSEYHVLREERFFEKNFPVGTWKLFYDDGTLAGETSYPKSVKEWMATRIRGRSEKVASLFSMDFRNPIEGREVWYGTDGIKQKEQGLHCYFDGNQYVVKESGELTFYDKYGQVIRQADLVNGTGSDVHDLSMMGIHYHKKLHWTGGRIFKEETTSMPSLNW